MRSNVYETVERPSVCLSVPSRGGLLLSAPQAGDIDR